MILSSILLSCSSVPALGELPCGASAEFLPNDAIADDALALQEHFGRSLVLPVRWSDGWAIPTAEPYAPQLLFGDFGGPGQVSTAPPECIEVMVFPIELTVLLTPGAEFGISGLGALSLVDGQPEVSFAFESDNYVEEVSDLGLSLIYEQRAMAYGEDWELGSLPETGSLFYRFGVSLAGTKESGTLVVYLRDISTERGTPTKLFEGVW